MASDGPYQVSARPESSAHGVPGNASGPSSAVNRTARPGAAPVRPRRAEFLERPPGVALAGSRRTRWSARAGAARHRRRCRAPSTTTVPPDRHHTRGRAGSGAGARPTPASAPAASPVRSDGQAAVQPPLDRSASGTVSVRSPAPACPAATQPLASARGSPPRSEHEVRRAARATRSRSGYLRPPHPGHGPARPGGCTSRWPRPADPAGEGHASVSDGTSDTIRGGDRRRPTGPSEVIGRGRRRSTRSLRSSLRPRGGRSGGCRRGPPSGARSCLVGRTPPG